MKQLVIIGAGGLGKEVLWAATNRHALQPLFEFLGFCDDAPVRQSGDYCGLPLLGSPEKAARSLTGEIFFVCGVGNNFARQDLVERADRLGWKAETIIDPSVLTAPGVTVGAGTYVGALSILAPDATLGAHVIVNHGCSIGHDSRLGDYCQVCPGGRISGHVELGVGAFLGSNAVVAPGVALGAWARLGAGSFAVRDIPGGATAVGNPARVLFNGPRKQGVQP
jgi:sugar O-acyltransferase (sialic acid O-acetyltransferase NeuD family)